jgi:hypothetical protein
METTWDGQDRGHHNQPESKVSPPLDLCSQHRPKRRAPRTSHKAAILCQQSHHATDPILEWGVLEGKYPT